MKKLLSLMLAAVLMLSITAGTVSAYSTTGSEPARIDEALSEKLAETSAVNPEDKISAELKARMEKISDDMTISVWAWTYDISDQQIDEMIAEAYGADFIATASPDSYRQARTAVITDYFSHANKEIADRLGVSGENRIFISSLTPSFILRLTKAQIVALSEMDEVVSIDRYENQIHIDDETAKTCRYLDSFSVWLDKRTSVAAVEIFSYRELYTQFDDNNEPLWAIIYAPDNIELPWEVRCGGIVGGRLISVIGGMGISTTGYFLYDVAANEFIGLTTVNAAKYRGLDKALEELKIGNPIGDVDFDKEISIYDVTRMQRILAELDGFGDDYYTEDPMTSGFTYQNFADFNRDGDFDILDATAVQRCLAGL